MTTTDSLAESVDQNASFDAIIVGAGFAGLYMLYRLRKAGRTARIYEQADNVGGTWYWNRYPGARCDAESLAYSYSWDEELEQQWEWTERYATQPEILRYIEHVAERHDLRGDIRFERRVESATYDEASHTWSVTTEQGDRATAPLCIMATGCLSVPMVPDIPGLDSFEGARHQASMWPHEGVDFSGERVGIIGTGSSAIQAIPLIAQEAGHLTVFQRTPNYSVPAQNAPLDPDWVGRYKQQYPEHRRHYRLALMSGFGDLEAVPRDRTVDMVSGHTLDDDALSARCEERWEVGGAQFMGVVNDALMDEAINARVADFVRQKIRDTVKDPRTAEALCPKTYPIGTKRICVDTDYYETFNRPNVELVDLHESPIERIVRDGIELPDRKVELDTLVLATGFDAMTGALGRIDIRGAGGLALREKWSEGPRAYLGLMSAGFPNLFIITGPGSPSVLSNMLISIEQHVDFIMDCLAHMENAGAAVVEADATAEDGWVQHVNEVASMTLFPKAGSWYMGANIPGKPRVFMPYAAGVGIYRQVCDDVIANDFRGLQFS